jgi:HAD superfamily hydrolase (TIGR01509 family)
MQIDSVVFDIGRVLVGFSFEGFKAFLREGGLHFAGTEEFLARTRMLDYETGRIDSVTFLDTLAGLFPEPVDRVELERQWVEIFTPIPRMLEYARALHARYRVYLGSNTSPLHWAYLCRTYALERLCRGALTSFEAGAMKPDAVFYRCAEERFALTPERTVFIDDLPANVDAARVRGWHAVRHETPAKTQAALQALGVTTG